MRAPLLTESCVAPFVYARSPLVSEEEVSFDEICEVCAGISGCFSLSEEQPVKISAAEITADTIFPACHHFFGSFKKYLASIHNITRLLDKFVREIVGEWFIMKLFKKPKPKWR